MHKSLNRLITKSLLLLTAACSANKPPSQPIVSGQTLMVAPDSLKWEGDADLAPILVKPELTRLVMDAAERVEMRLGNSEFIERLSVIAEDTANPWLVRVNALRLLANRGAVGELPVFSALMRDHDERVRIATVSSMREFLALREQTAVEILEFAFHDESIHVQMAALQMFGDRDPEPLRDLAARTRYPDVKKIAIDLVRAAEERGAPLVEKDTAGTLERVSSAGPILTYKPTQRWKHWDASTGDLYVAVPGSKKPQLVASGVEVVANVVPAFFTSDGRTLVYELHREIHSRDMATGADKKIADGIAPRILPFTNDIIFMTEVRAKRSETPNSFGLRYDVNRVPAIGGTATVLGQVGAQALNDLHGNYSTVRWTRIRENEGNFTLTGDLKEPFTLPSPFGQ